MKPIIKQRKWFWAWQDEQEEAWLHEMSLKGLHLVRAQPFGAYQFEQGEPRPYVYRLDYRDSKSDQDSYVQLFADAGWGHIGQMSGWQYFRREATAVEATDGEMPEIFTDTESKIRKYRRLQTLLAILIPILLSLIPIYRALFTIVPAGPYIIPVALLFVIIVTVAVQAILKLEERIKQLKRW